MQSISVQYIQKTNVYRIKNRRTNTCLAFNGCIGLAVPQSQKISQLWLIDQIKQNNYEIVSLQSGQVLARKEEIILEKGNWSAPQLWNLERAQMSNNQNYYWVTSSEDETQYLFALMTKSSLQLKNYDRTLFACNWVLQQVDTLKDLPGCFIFKSEHSGLVIDVPEGSNKEGISIIQFSLNGRGNQRWVLDKVLDSYVIKNLCSNMILCPHNKSIKAGSKIIQTQFTNRTEQKWLLEKQGNQQNKFLIRNKADTNIFLGVASTRQSGQLQLVNERQKGIWVLVGPVLQS